MFYRTTSKCAFSYNFTRENREVSQLIFPQGIDITLQLSKYLVHRGEEKKVKESIYYITFFLEFRLYFSKPFYS